MCYSRRRLEGMLGLGGPSKRDLSESVSKIEARISLYKIRYVAEYGFAYSSRVRFDSLQIVRI